jgi:hypothetical protein
MCNVCGEWLLCAEKYFHKNIEKRREYDKDYNKEHWDKKKLQFKDRYENKNEEWAEYQNGYLKRPSSKEKQKVYQKKYKKKKHKITKQEWLDCKNYFNNCCAYCELPVEEHYRRYNKGIQKIDLHKEHIDDNGTNDLSNCVPSCQSCNSGKREEEFNVWYNKDNHKFTQERYNRIIKWLTEDYKLFIKEKK